MAFSKLMVCIDISFLNHFLSFSQEKFACLDETKLNIFPASKAEHLKALEKLGVPVPFFFVVPYAQLLFFKDLQEGLLKLQSESGKVWNDKNSGEHGLFVSVRSSFSVSMPGMLDSLLNVGLTFGHALEGNQEYLWRNYIKLMCNYGELVEKIDKNRFPKISEHATQQEALKFEKIFEQYAGHPFPQDSNEQLIKAFLMVKNSWENPRAKIYRFHENIVYSSGVDVIVQMMVFGNLDRLSGTGIVFTRNPSTGKKELFGEYSIQAQGEDLVSGVTTPGPIALLENELPHAYQTLKDLSEKIEDFFMDMQDIEFTIEKEKLWILQTRPGKRTKIAELNILLQYVEEGRLNMKEAFQRLSLKGLEQLHHPYLESLEGLEILGKGLGVSPGAVSGVLATCKETVDFFVKEGKNVIFAAQETHCDDIASILKASGVITSTGGMTCHGAVVTRGLGKPCVTSVQGLQVCQHSVIFSNRTFLEGDFITIDGTTGEIWKGIGILTTPTECPNLKKFLDFAQHHNAIKIYVNADTSQDWQSAAPFLPHGIGLCRSEHMFFQDTHLPWFQAWILGIQKEKSSVIIRDLQEEDYKNLFRLLRGKRLTVRLLDPPLHEFLPSSLEAEKILAQKLEISVDVIKQIASELREKNPMLGKRGARLGLTRPEIYDLQIHALFKASEHVYKEGISVNLGIMIPFVMTPEEFVFIKNRIFQSSLQYNLSGIDWNVGVMIEVPSAAIQASFFAQEADFICFGTNDLTQMTLGISRDDTAGVIKHYQSVGIFSQDPFQSIHQSSVGKIISFACESIFKVNPNFPLSVCGEHGGDPESIKFFYSLGIREISCSAYRITQAKLSGAKVTLGHSFF
ncbi:pyruvate, phosphate dikinase [Holospora obtusa F1]|uniref:Pyruvate, phosphate dikinase n=1 Tax=Holospora obtusa F1 TaxID=1399147 RepID=W6TFI5_HOLOB|nr:putative PEP-binding protein [Holospora obtusa]ETZ07769.1 pyruvate, phosphate dikinase [Holospora obtusa F1]